MKHLAAFLLLCGTLISAQVEITSEKNIQNVSEIDINPAIETIDNIRYDSINKNFKSFDGTNWEDSDKFEIPVYKEYGSGDNVLIWLREGSTAMTDYVKEGYSDQMKVIVVEFKVEGDQLSAVKDINKSLAYFLHNRESLGIKKLYLGSNSLGAGYVLNSVANHGFNPDGLIIYYPQSTWHMDKFSEVLQSKYGTFNPAPFKSRFALQLYGTENPTKMQMDALDFLKPIKQPIWIYAYKDEAPTKMDQILHNRVHADALCQIATACYINQTFHLLP